MIRTRPLHDAGLALSLLTIVPTRARFTEGERTGAAAWFPAVGVLVGAASWGLVHALRYAGWKSAAVYTVAAAVVAISAVLTRMLHWDGLADVADALWGGDTPKRRLEIMADSHTGAFGATAIALCAIVEVAAIGSILTNIHELPLLIVPAFARLSPTAAAWLGKPARSGGLGRSVMGPPRLAEIAIAGVVIGTCLWAVTTGYGPSGAVFGVSAVVLALVVPHLLSLPTEGVTGDIMGASVLICEATLFASAAILWGA